MSRQGVQTQPRPLLSPKQAYAQIELKKKQELQIMTEFFNRVYMLHFHSILMKFECLILLGSLKIPVRITRCINYD